MSRTRHHRTRRRDEYWGTRGYPNARMATPGTPAKRRTHRTERRTLKAQCHDDDVPRGPDWTVQPGAPLISGGRRQPLPEGDASPIQ